jgi:hypothetical protein
MNKQQTPNPIVEIVGLPGSGKTSLVKRLQTLSSNIEIHSFPYYRRVECIPFFFKYSFQYFPRLLNYNIDKEKGWFRPRDISSMVILSGWFDELSQPSIDPEKTIILDEGAVEILVWLHSMGSDFMKSQPLTSWWSEMYQKWASRLKTVIYLNASPQILLDRIRTRDNNWKSMSDDQIFLRLNALQFSQEYVLATVSAKNPNLRILRFSTEKSSLDQISLETLCELNT